MWGFFEGSQFFLTRLSFDEIEIVLEFFVRQGWGEETFREPSFPHRASFSQKSAVGFSSALRNIN